MDPPGSLQVKLTTLALKYCMSVFSFYIVKSYVFLGCPTFWDA